MYTPKGEINDELLKLVQDPEVLQKIGECKEPEAGYAVVKEHIPGISMEDFKQSMTVMHSYLAESEEGLLSDEDLDAVAGGKSSKTTVTAVLGGIGGAAGVAGAVAGAVSAAAFMS